MFVSELLLYGVKELEASGVTGADVDVQLLLGHCLGKSRTQLFLAAKESVPEKSKQKFFQLIKRRKKREPVAYLLGEREFWSLPFFINQDVLIPRPETEFLVESVLARFRKVSGEKGKVLDLCCGSGVIGIILALELKMRVVALDISQAALRIAQKNSIRHEVEGLVDFVNSDLFSAIIMERKFSLIVSNPPYIEQNEIASLEPDVQNHEPRIALDGGPDGLDIINKICQHLPTVLQPGGSLFMEIGADQKEGVQRLFENVGCRNGDFEKVEILKDYAGRNRVLYVKMNE